jgi:hypothetical protein
MNRPFACLLLQEKLISPEKNSEEAAVLDARNMLASGKLPVNRFTMTVVATCSAPSS